MKKIICSLSVLLLLGTVTTALVVGQPGTVGTQGLDATDTFKELSRNTQWQQKEQIDLQFDAHHPQGMTRIGDLFYMSSVEIIEKPEKYDQPRNGYDRTPGKGVGHLFVFDKTGKLVKDIELGEGHMYHPGGIAYDGKSIWVPVAEYRPDSRSIMYQVDPDTLKAEEAFRVDDHIGGVSRDSENGKLTGVSWGSRHFYQWNEQGKTLRMKTNPSHFIDYQDCESAGQGKAICSGISELPNPEGSKPYELGGLALLDTATLDLLHEVPVTEFSAKGHVATRNPAFLENTDQGMRLYAVPDDDEASLLVYETQNEE
ncbi:hypothetical protein C8P63_1266 [Melghirimyces profundicolus]|uniref:Uncharacterized protein n=1 Tax=Melghirimyces profundicolus TaxID=1242148 RepID=A0A2T6BCB8_9BACL|nr:DUF6454 family protein [Melghirimyces profundicolus]PTX53720.1 hypothetical protein C8P63_1266 [Melghirimyces profundicolus]